MRTIVLSSFVLSLRGELSYFQPLSSTEVAGKMHSPNEQEKPLQNDVSYLSCHDPNSNAQIMMTYYAHAQHSLLRVAVRLIKVI